MMWRVLAALSAVSLLCVHGEEALSNRPRGVRPQLASLYAEKEEFECLDGSKKISYAYVNDDYCDCADGSDEPGTSACPNGRFYCPNRGFRPQELPSSLVNDMICGLRMLRAPKVQNCCDGSDEWDSGVNCPNVCDSLGAEAREAAKKQRVVYEAGWAKRSEMAKQGAKALEEKKSELGKQKKELEELQPLKSATEEAKNAAETREREAKEKEDNAWNALQDEKKKTKARELFDRLDEDKDGKLTLVDLQKHSEFDGDLDGQISEEEAKSYLGETGEADFEAFYSSAYHQVKDLFRKATTVEKVDVPQKEAAETATEPPKPAETPEEHSEEGDEGAEEDEEFPHDDIAPESHVEKPEDEPEEQRPPYTAETQALIEEAERARKAWRDTLDKVNELETTIKDSEQFLEFEYGPDHAWAPLKGQCAELNEGQYTYKLCLFDRATQKDKNGYSEVNLGHWNSWAGPETDKHTAQKYDRGQGCWNGPERSTHVDIECGEETQLVEASEPAKCEYRFKLRSPAACTDPAKLDEPYHTEL